MTTQTVAPSVNNLELLYGSQTRTSPFTGDHLVEDISIEAEEAGHQTRPEDSADNSHQWFHYQPASNYR